MSLKGASFFISILFMACRSGHFEERSLSSSQIGFQVSLFSSTFLGPSPGHEREDEPHHWRMEMKLSLRTLQDEPIQNHSFQISLQHPALLSQEKFKATTDILGQLQLEIDFEVDPMNSEAIYEMGLEIHSSYFGAESLSALIQVLKKEGPVISLKEQPSSFQPSIQTEPLDLEVEVLRMRQRSSEKITPAETLFSLEAILKIHHRKTQLPLTSQNIFWKYQQGQQSEQGSQKTNALGELTLTLKIPYFPYRDHQLEAVHLFLEGEEFPFSFDRYFLLNLENPQSPLVDWTTLLPAKESSLTPILLRLLNFKLLPAPTPENFSPKYEIQFEIFISRKNFEVLTYRALQSLRLQGKVLFLTETNALLSESMFDVVTDEWGKALLSLENPDSRASKLFLAFFIPDLLHAPKGYWEISLTELYPKEKTSEEARVIGGGALVNLTIPFLK